MKFSQLSFDDGPIDSSTTLYYFLQHNEISSKATHFMIGGNIVGTCTIRLELLCPVHSCLDSIPPNYRPRQVL